MADCVVASAFRTRCLTPQQFASRSDSVGRNLAVVIPVDSRRIVNGKMVIVSRSDDSGRVGSCLAEMVALCLGDGEVKKYGSQTVT